MSINKNTTMKYILIFLSLILLGTQLQGQQAFQWAVNAGSANKDIVNAICSEKGDFYITGSYSDIFYSEGKEINSAGGTDIYLVKFNKDGKSSWVKSYGGLGNDEANCLVIGDKDLFIAGSINGDVSFSGKEYSGNGSAIFVASYADNGKTQWLSRFNYEGNVTVDALQYLTDGKLLLGGFVYGTLEAGDETLKSKGVSRAYSLIISADGDVEKAILSSGKGNHRLISAANTADNCKYMLFSISGKFNYGSEGLQCSSGNVSRGVVLVKTSKDDAVLWHKVYECPDYSEGIKVVANSEGGVYAIANFTNDFVLEDTVLHTNGQLQTAIIAYNKDGDQEWVQHIKSPTKCKTIDAVLSHSGELLVTGSYRNQYSCGDIEESGEEAMGDLFLLQFDKEGHPVWHDEPGEKAASFSKAITLDEDGNVVLTGSFRNELTIGEQVLVPIGNQDILVAKYFNCGQNLVKIADATPICPGTTKELKASNGFDTYLWNGSIYSKSIMVDEPGTYKVVATDNLGCSSTDTANIILADIPELNLGEDATLTEGDEIVLLAQEGFVSYQWDDGFVGPSRSVTYNANKEPTIYSLVAETESGCLASDSITINFVGENLELSPLSPFSSFSVYPNPVVDKLNWYINLYDPTTIIVKLTAPNGMLFFEETIDKYLPNTIKTIDMGNMVSGNYLLSFECKGVVVNEKIVKN